MSTLSSWVAGSSFLCISWLLWRYIQSRRVSIARSFGPGTVVIITGASSGIGASLSARLCAVGATVLVTGRTHDALEAQVEVCRAARAKFYASRTDIVAETLHGGVLGVIADAQSSEDNARVVRTTLEAFGRIDCVILNAGRGCLMTARDTPPSVEPLREMMDVNFFGAVALALHALPALRESCGRIVAVSSLGSLVPTPRRGAYGASKAALNSFLQVLRVEEPDIAITIACPGFVKTPFHDRILTPGTTVQRHTGGFMTGDRAAELILLAAAQRKRMAILTTSGILAYKLYAFLPLVVDFLAKRKAEASVKDQ